MKYQCLEQHRGALPVKRACGLLGVAVSGYYAWRQQQACVSVRTQDEAQWVEQIRQQYQYSRGTYGSPRITAALRQAGHTCNRKRIARLMHKYGIVAQQKRRFQRTTRANPEHRVVPNVLQRQFHATRPHEKWLSDFTYLETAEGWVYFAAVLDVFSRKIVGWALSERMDSALVSAALQMALQQRGTTKPALSLLHHSDRGSQYTSEDYQALLIQHGITSSMSGGGTCYDNAMMESFFGTLKTECADACFMTREAARGEVFAYVEGWYNRRRLHSGIGYRSPQAVEQAYFLDRN